MEPSSTRIALLITWQRHQRWESMRSVSMRGFRRAPTFAALPSCQRLLHQNAAAASARGGACLRSQAHRGLSGDLLRSCHDRIPEVWGANCYSRHRCGVDRHMLREVFWLDYDPAPMRDLFVLFVHLAVTAVRLMRPGGARAIVAESLLLKQQLLIVTRSRPRAPDLRSLDRIIAGLCARLLQKTRIQRCAIVLKPATILSFQRLLVKRKYRELFSPKRRGRPGPKGPSAALVAAIVEMKRKNPQFGYQRIADQMALAFDVPVDKHLVRRVLAKHNRPGPGSGGPSWLTFLGHSKDSLWSVDLFRCESLILRTHWVMVVMDQFTRRNLGFAVCQGSPDGLSVCRMLRHIVLGSAPPNLLEFRPRSPVRIPPLESQSADSGSERGQVGSLRTAFTPIRGTSGWNGPARISRPDAALERPGPRTKAELVPGILQPLSGASGAQGTSTRPESWQRSPARGLPQ